MADKILKESETLGYEGWIWASYPRPSVDDDGAGRVARFRVAIGRLPEVVYAHCGRVEELKPRLNLEGGRPVIHARRGVCIQ